MRVRRLAAVSLSAALLVAGCGGNSNDKTSTSGPSGSSSAQGSMKVGLAYDVGGRGDQSFNDAAAAGLDKAVAELKLPKPNEAEAAQGESEAQKEERLRLLAEDDYNPIVAVGFAYEASLAKVAKDFPDIHFAIIDDAVTKGPNIANLVFAEEQGSFLVGAAAALKTKSNNIGFVGGVDVPLIQKFQAGYVAGAKAVKPGIQVQVKYLTQPPDFSGFGDPAKGKTAATGMYDKGADVVYQAAGGSGGGVFEAAKAAGAWAIGVDSDQAKTAAAGVRDVILTSMLKKVDVAVYDYLTAASKGDFLSGEKVYDLKVGGVGYSTTGGHVDDITSKLDAYKQKIISGEITVPTKP